MQLYEWTHTHTRAHTQMTGSEWKWRIWSSIPLHYAADGVQAKPGQASPRRERVREKEGKRDDGGGVEKRGEGQSCCLFFLSFFFNLRERTCLFSFFFFLTPSRLPRGTESFSSLLLFLCSSSHHLSAPSSPLLPSWGYTWAQPRRLQPQLTRRKEAEDRGGKRWEQRERWSMEYFGDILTEKIDQRTFFCCCFTWKNYNHVCLGVGAVYSD